MSGRNSGSDVQNFEINNSAEELADDVRNLSTLVHALRIALIATGQIKWAA